MYPLATSKESEEERGEAKLMAFMCYIFYRSCSVHLTMYMYMYNIV